MTTRRDNTLGIVLIVIGIAIFLLNTNVLPDDVLLLFIGAAFIVGYYNKRVTGYLIAGLILIAIGAGELIDNFGFTTIDLSGFLFMSSLGIVFLTLYFVKDIKGFIYPGCILPAIGIFSLMDEIFSGDIGWAFFLLLSLSFFAIYILDLRGSGVNWPLIPGTVLLVLSVLFFLVSENIIKYSFWRALSYIWPIIIILIGARIIYNNTRHKNY